MPYFSISLAILGGICIYAGTHFLFHFKNCFQRTRPNYLYLQLGASALAIAAFLMGELYLYHSHDPISYATAFKWRLIFGLIFITIWPWFTYTYTKIGPRWLVIMLSAYMGLHFFINVARPYGTLFYELPVLTTRILPWGESIVWHERQVSLVYILGWLGVFLIIFYTFYACIRQYLKANKSSLFLFIANLIFAILLVENFIVITQNLNFVLLAQYGFPLFIILMGIKLHQESQEDRDRINDIINYMPASISIKSFDGQHLMGNQRYETDIREYHDNRIKNGKVDRLFSGSDSEIKNFGSLIEYEEKFLDNKKDTHFYHTLEFPLLDTKNNPYAICNIITDVTEQKKLANQLAYSEIKYRSLFESAGDAILVLDGNIIIDCNESALTMFNCIREDIINRNPVELSPITQYDGRPSSEVAKEKLLSVMNGHRETFNWQHQQLGGALFDAEVSLSLIEINGKDCIQGIVRDITLRKRTEDSIKTIATGICGNTGNAFFEQLVISISKLFQTKYAFIGVINEDDKQKINTLATCRNSQIIDNFSYSLPHTPCKNVVTSGDCSYTKGVHKAFPKDTLLANLEIESYIGSPLLDSTGKTIGLIVLLHDKELKPPIWLSEIMQIFTARAGAELERLHAVKDLHIKDRAMEAAQEGIILLEASENNPVMYSNSAMGNITGYSAEELLRKGFDILFGEKTNASSSVNIYSALHEQAPLKETLLLYKKDDVEMWGDISITPVKDELDNVSHFIVTLEDITEKRLTENALRQSQKMEAIGQIASGVSHDFNNKLGIILGYIDFISSALKEDKKLQKWMETVITATESCVSLTRQLLTFSRQTSDEAQYVDINHELLKMDDLISRTLTPAISVKTICSPGVWPVNINPNEFQDIILNLVINARDAIEVGGSILIETRNVSDSETPETINGEGVLVSVTDNGNGMDSKTLSHVFEPFFTTKPEGKGTGLGLAMVYSFIKRCDGIITVDSKLGKGTTLKLYFPRLKDISFQKQEFNHTKKVLPRGSESILVTDDEKELCNLARQYLEPLGYKVFTANSPNDALEILGKEQNIDLLFTDIIMPGEMSGYTLIKQAKSVLPTLDVLIATGFEPKKSIDSEFASDIPILYKPYRQEELAISLRQTLDKT